jgi:hypothetical protein
MALAIAATPARSLVWPYNANAICGEDEREHVGGAVADDDERNGPKCGDGEDRNRSLQPPHEGPEGDSPDDETQGIDFTSRACRRHTHVEQRRRDEDDNVSDDLAATISR